MPVFLHWFNDNIWFIGLCNFDFWFQNRRISLIHVHWKPFKLSYPSGFRLSSETYGYKTFFPRRLLEYFRCLSCFWMRVYLPSDDDLNFFLNIHFWRSVRRDLINNLESLLDIKNHFHCKKAKPRSAKCENLNRLHEHNWHRSRRRDS